MPRDLIAEQALIDLSRVQRVALERWFGILLMAGEADLAEEIRAEITAADQDERKQAA